MKVEPVGAMCIYLSEQGAEDGLRYPPTVGDQNRTPIERAAERWANRSDEQRSEFRLVSIGLGIFLAVTVFSATPAGSAFFAWFRG